MKTNNSKDNFRFDIPDTMGFCSSWAENFNPEGNYVLTKRKKVKLKEINAKSIITNKPQKMFLRDPEGTIKGVSSGAGSSLLKDADNVYKIKRNGYKENGPTYNPFSYKDNKDGKQTTKILEYRGILTKNQALGEYNALIKLKKEGLCEAYDPIDVLEYTIPFTDQKAYSVITKIKSEVRFDELIFGIQGEVIANKVNSGQLIFDKKTGMFNVNNLDEKEFSNKTLQDDLYIIGYCLGSYYKEFHRKGWVRGYPHSWFGNEIINEDGTISFVDLEEATNKKENLELHQKTERYQAQSALFAEFEHLGIRGLAHNAATLAEAFRQGYDESLVPGKIPRSTLNRFKVNTKKAIKALWG